MPKFRKKPVVIEATQWFVGVQHPGVRRDGSYRDMPERGDKLDDGYYVVTIHGQRAYVKNGDWILPEPQEGLFYPCKPDIFAATYEPVDERGSLGCPPADTPDYDQNYR